MTSFALSPFWHSCLWEVGHKGGKQIRQPEQVGASPEHTGKTRQGEQLEREHQGMQTKPDNSGILVVGVGENGNIPNARK